MDHKVSKDMISSGMIPSGEKTQADLGRTQYGSAPSPSKLMDAYKSMYEKNEVINEHHKKDADGNTIPHEGEELNEGKIPAGLQAYLDKKKGKKEDKKEVKEETDLFDVISTHFINEGYEEKDVYKAMASLTEDQLQNLDEALPAIGAALAAIPAIAGKLATGAAVAGKTAVAAGTKGLMAAGKAGLGAAKGAMKGVVSAAKPVTQGISKVASKATTGVKDMVGKGATQVKKVVNPQPANKQLSLDLGKAGKSSPTGSSNTGQNKVVDFLKREGEMKLRQELTKDREVQGTNKTSLASAQKTNVAASADLFDIVKGRLLDEGLSEEEIKDIMLTLTPDEIMEELSDTVKRNDALNRERAMKAAQERKVPENVRAAQKRQYTAGGPKDTGENKYTTQDKKTIIDYHKNKESM